MRHAINISVFINYFSISRVAFMKIKRHTAKLIMIFTSFSFEIDSMVFFIVSVQLFGRKDLIIMYFSIIYDH